MSIEAPIAETPTAEELDDLVNSVPVENNDTRELSPTASRLNRLSSMINHVAEALTDRANNRAYGEALKEDNSRTENAQNDAYDSYSGNIAATHSRERNDRKEAFEAQIDNAKTFVKKAGRSALEHTINAGVITVDIGLLAGEAMAKTTVTAAEKGRDLAEAGALKTMYAADEVKSGLETASLSAMYAIDKGRDVVTETVDSLRQKLADRAEVATNRREARRARWSARKESFIGRSHEAIDTTKEKGQNVLSRAHAARAAGSAALAVVISAKKSAQETYKTHLDQNRL